MIWRPLNRNEWGNEHPLGSCFPINNVENLMRFNLIKRNSILGVWYEDLLKNFLLAISKLTSKNGLAFYDVNVHLLWVLIVKRPLTAANFVEKHAETPHVSFKTGSDLFEYLRCYVVGRATVSISFAVFLQPYA